MTDFTEREADLIVMAWQAGREYERARMEEAADEMRLIDLAPPHRTYEERVQERIALFEKCAAQRGGTPWMGVAA